MSSPISILACLALCLTAFAQQAAKSDAGLPHNTGCFSDHDFTFADPAGE